MNQKVDLLSVVIPIYNEQESIAETMRRLLELRTSQLGELEFELLFVDDGSNDGSLAMLRKYAEQHLFIRVISFSRNFGHQIAITAGIDNAKGDYVAVIDADLQDPPELIVDMYRVAVTGIEVVYGRRRSRRGETVLKKFTAAAFYRVLNVLCEVEIPLDTGDFRLMSRKVVDELNKMREHHRFIRGMVPWLGFKTAALEYDRAERFAGETKYPIKKMLFFASNAIISFSSKPLVLASRLGLLTIGAGSLGGFYLLYLKAFTTAAVPGVTAVILSIVIFSGIQILLIGIVGQYIARIFEEMKGRPLYVVTERINE